MRGNGECAHGYGLSSGDGLSELSTNEVIKELVRHTRELVKDEVRLIKLELDEERRALGDIAGEGKSSVAEVKSRARHDVDLASAELNTAVGKAKKAGIELGSGGILLHAGLYLACFTLVFVLDTFLPLWLAALLVTALVCAVGGALLAKGKHDVDEIENPFTRITYQIKEDGRWIGRTLAGLKTRTAETLREAKSTLKESVSLRSPQSSSDAPRGDM